MSFVTGLRCRECARAFPAEALHVCDFCFGPLEVVYDYERAEKPVTRERIASGPQTIWRYADLLPVDDPCTDRPRRRDDPARAGRPPRSRARARRALDQGRHRQPDRILQGPRRLGRPHQGPRARLQGRRLRVDRATSPTPSRRTPRGPGCSRSSSSPATSRRAKIVTTAVYGGLVVAVDGNYDDVNRLCAELASDRPGMGVRERQRPHLLRRGLEDPRLRGRRAARLGGSRPRRRPDRLGQPADEDRQGIPGAARASGCSTPSPT